MAAEGRVLRTRAPAKVNLTLEVLGRRPDGYHDLHSLVVFAGVADDLALEPGEATSMRVEGPTAAHAGPTGDNLVLRAARRLQERVPGLRTGQFHLVKRLPAAAGIGGGSSDAAAALRLLARLNGLSADDPRLLDAARATGSDVPVCLAPRARIMAGAGERVGPTLGLPPLSAILVNPGVAVETPKVFAALGLAAGETRRTSPRTDVDHGLPATDLLRAIAAGVNDMQGPACQLAPAVAEALALIAASGATVARMSGSGATCFGLYPDPASAKAAAVSIRRQRPGWWVAATRLR